MREAQNHQATLVKNNCFIKFFSICNNIKYIPKSQVNIKAPCHLLSIQKRAVKGEMEKIVDSTNTQNDRMRGVLKTIFFCSTILRSPVIMKITPEVDMKNCDFVNSKFPFTQNDVPIQNVEKSFECISGREKNRKISNALRIFSSIIYHICFKSSIYSNFGFPLLSSVLLASSVWIAIFSFFVVSSRLYLMNL